MKNVWEYFVISYKKQIAASRVEGTIEVLPNKRGFVWTKSLYLSGQPLNLALGRDFGGCVVEANGEYRGQLNAGGSYELTGLRIGMNEIIVREPN